MPGGKQGLSRLIRRFKAVLVSIDFTLRQEKAQQMPRNLEKKTPEMLNFTQSLQIRISHLQPGAGSTRRPGSQSQGHHLLASLFATSSSGHLCQSLSRLHTFKGLSPASVPLGSLRLSRATWVGVGFYRPGRGGASPGPTLFFKIASAGFEFFFPFKSSLE